MCTCTWLYPTLCNPVDCSLPGSYVHGIFQARILEQVAISYSRISSPPKDQTQSLVSSALAGRFFPTDNTQEVTVTYIWLYINLTETKKPKIYNRYTNRIEIEKRKESRQNTKSSLQITREETKENNPKTINKMT